MSTLTQSIFCDITRSEGRVFLSALGSREEASDSPSEPDGDPRVWSLVYRFDIAPVPMPAGPCWAIGQIIQEVIRGLSAGAKAGDAAAIDRLSVRGFGADFGLLGRSGALLGLPRDGRVPFGIAAEAENGSESESDGAPDGPNASSQTDAASETAGSHQLAEATTAAQLQQQQTIEPGLLQSAVRLLLVPDLIHYALTGAMVTGLPWAASTGLLDTVTGNWNLPEVESLGLPMHLLGQIVEPGATIGKLRPELAKIAGLSDSVRVEIPRFGSDPISS